MCIFVLKLTIMVGRKEQIRRLEDALKSKRPEFIAVTGRRRVGKTYLIDQTYKEHICFQLTGIQDGSMQRQLVNFAQKLAEATDTPYVATPSNWQEAFLQLKSFLTSLPKRKKHIVFIDELPWVQTARSGFLQMLAHLWNDFLSKQKNFILVVCGSATSWITKKIVNDKGGLHNRLTDVIILQPFTLTETREFLRSKNIRLTSQEIVKLYLAMGGIPYYLEKIRKGESATRAIERMCFQDNGLLRNEYQNLYKALFERASNHEAIVAALATARKPLTRREIVKKSGVAAGGPYNRTMEDLTLSGFVQEVVHFGRKQRGSNYRLVDEYSIFYHKFIKTNKRYQKGIWNRLATSQTYKIWTGYAFEALCFRHLDKIKYALGISGVFTTVSSLNVQDDEQGGFQIDMIIDRQDNTINLCELKYYSGEYTITKDYAKKLNQRKHRFIDYIKTKKQIFMTFITNYGVKKNMYYNEMVDSEVVVEDLF